jgi:hypothetical protein
MSEISGIQEVSLAKLFSVPAMACCLLRIGLRMGPIDPDVPIEVLDGQIVYEPQKTYDNARATVIDNRALFLTALLVEIPAPCCGCPVALGLSIQDVADGTAWLAVAP